MRRYLHLMIPLQLLFSVGCSTVIPVSFPEYPEGREGRSLLRLTAGKKNLAVIARPLDPALARKINLQASWHTMVEGRVGEALRESGFYNILDVGARKERLRELAYSQSGLTERQLAIGQEMQADLLLIISMTAPPMSVCGTDRKSGNVLRNLIKGKEGADPANRARSEKPSTGMSIVDFIGTGGGLFTEVAPVLPTVGIRDTTVFVTGTLVNIETGESITFTNTTPYRLESDINSMDCPSELKALDGAMTFASYRVAANVSPSLVTYEIPLADDGEGVRRNADSVVTLLKKGNSWAEAGNFDRARDFWQQGLDESEGLSASALWNLAAYLWHTGDFDGAAEHFERSLKNASESWFDAEKKKTFTRFEDSRKKMQQ